MKNSVIGSARGCWLARKLATVSAALVAATLVCSSSAAADDGPRSPDLPLAVCEAVSAPAGHRVSFRAYALGVQIYAWDGAAWVFQGPEAGLYADPGYHGQVGTHYGGPTWEANDGSKVQAAVVDRCSPNPGAIPWLLLERTATEGRGLFARVSYIQRVNTIGGTAPAQPGTFIGEVARVPYSAEYYFYRANGR